MGLKEITFVASVSLFCFSFLFSFLVPLKSVQFSVLIDFIFICSQYGKNSVKTPIDKLMCFILITMNLYSGLSGTDLSTQTTVSGSRSRWI